VEPHNKVALDPILKMHNKYLRILKRASYLRMLRSKVVVVITSAVYYLERLALCVSQKL